MPYDAVEESLESWSMEPVGGYYDSFVHGKRWDRGDALQPRRSLPYGLYDRTYRRAISSSIPKMPLRSIVDRQFLLSRRSSSSLRHR